MGLYLISMPSASKDFPAVASCAAPDLDVVRSHFNRIVNPLGIDSNDPSWPGEVRYEGGTAELMEIRYTYMAGASGQAAKQLSDIAETFNGLDVYVLAADNDCVLLGDDGTMYDADNQWGNTFYPGRINSSSKIRPAIWR